MIYIIAIAVYLVSVYFVWRYMRIAHSKGGIWYNLDIDAGTIFWTVAPVFNTIAVFLAYVFFPPKERKRNYNKFFKIKK